MTDLPEVQVYTDGARSVNSGPWRMGGNFSVPGQGKGNQRR